MFHNHQKKPILKIFVSFPRVVCVALATTVGLQCSCCPCRGEGSALRWGSDTFLPPPLLHPLGCFRQHSDNTFPSPSPLHCQRHWDAHSRSQRNPTPCRAGKTCARHQAEDKLRRGLDQVPPMFCVQTERQSIIFGCAFSISNPGLQRCQSGG